MGQRSQYSLMALLLALVALAAPLRATKIGRMTLVKSPEGTLLQVQTDSLTAPVLQTAQGKLVIVVPGGERDLKTVEVSSGPIARIRFGKEGADLHIVLDLRQKVSGRIIHNAAKGFGVALTLVLGPGLARGGDFVAKKSGETPVTAPVNPTVVDSLNPATTSYTYRVVDLSLQEQEKHSDLIVSADGPANYTSAVREGGRLLTVDFHNSSLAWSGDENALNDEAVAGVTAKQMMVDGEARVRVELHLTGKWDYSFKRDQNQLVVRLNRPAKIEAVATSGDMNTLVSLDVQGADMVGVLKTLCEQAGFDYQFTRVLLSKGPPETSVTMKVDNRPFHEVLDTLLAQVASREVRLGNTIYMGSQVEIDARQDRLPVVSKTYAPKYLTIKQITTYLTDHYFYDEAAKARLKGVTTDPRNPGDMLLLGTPEEVAGWLVIIREVDVPESGDDGSGGGATHTQVFHLEYLDNSNSGLINGAIAQLYPDGETLPTPLIDSATRTLVVTTRPKYLRMIEKLLQKIDVKPLQVNIEGKIVEVDQNVASQLGINWTGTSTSTGNQAQFLPAFITPFTSQLTYGVISNGINIQAQIQALVDTQKANIVSAPNITTIDNLPATISTTQVQVYVQTTTTISNGVVTNANTYPTSNVPLTLVVTPKISRSDHRVLMNINFQLTTTNGTPPVVGAPFPTNQESAVTNVSVDSGSTFVIGGLVKQNDTEEVRKIPILGDIPLLGLLFKSTNIAKTKSEVIIFIKPTIVAN